MRAISIIGCGFVADLYMRSFALYPDIQIIGVYDKDAARAQVFAQYWKLENCSSLDALLAKAPADGVVLNLTNPDAHFEVNLACLTAGHHVYSEKPLATRFEDAQRLVDLAQEKNLHLASAPCSVLGQAAQTLGHALRNQVLGQPKLIYAELDDGYIVQAPYKKWFSPSGAPWPYEDEFRVGCTLEHAGYYLTWLIACFGSVASVTAASAEVVADKGITPLAAPDFSVATLFFESGMVARLTCSIVAPHDHGLRVFCDDGVISVDKAWDNNAPVKLQRRLVLRRKLIEKTRRKTYKLKGKTHPKVGRWGAASMNFALGPVEVLEAVDEGRACRLSPEFALHLTEVTLAIQNAGRDAGAQKMRSRCDVIEPMPWAQ